MSSNYHGQEEERRTSDEHRSIEDKLRRVLASSPSSQSSLSHRLLDLLLSSLSTGEESQGAVQPATIPVKTPSSSSSFSSSTSYSSAAIHQNASTRSSTVDSVATVDFNWEASSTRTQLIAESSCADVEALPSLPLPDASYHLSHGVYDYDSDALMKQPDSFDWLQMSADDDCPSSRADFNSGVEQNKTNNSPTEPAPIQKSIQKSRWPVNSTRNDLSGVFSSLSAALAATEERAHQRDASLPFQSTSRVMEQRPSLEATNASSSRPPLEERAKKKRRRWNEVSRPFQCPHCPKSYGTRSHLNTHLRSVCHEQSSKAQVVKDPRPSETASIDTLSSPPFHNLHLNRAEECSHQVNTRARQVSDVSSASSLRDDITVFNFQQISSPPIDISGFEDFATSRSCHSESFPNELQQGFTSYTAAAERSNASEEQTSSSSYQSQSPLNSLIETKASERQRAQTLPDIDAEDLLRQLDDIRNLLHRFIGAQNQTVASQEGQK